ncbi:MAG: ABC transporter permease [Oscillospiraceae bacterium]
MEYSWDENGNITGEMPPSLYYVSDQYSACSNLTWRRDLAYLDIKIVTQVCVIGAQAAKTFFGSADPVGKELQVNGNPFLVVGVYGSRLSEESATTSTIDNFIAFPYTAPAASGGRGPQPVHSEGKGQCELE